MRLSGALLAEVQRELRAILNEWDPIGAFDTDDLLRETRSYADEYDDIREPLIALLARGGDRERVAELLRTALRDGYELSVSLVTEALLDRVFAWWRVVLLRSGG